MNKDKVGKKSETISEKLLLDLDIERGKYANYDEIEMQRLIDRLVEVGTYPSEPTQAMKKNGYTILTMVKSWGVDWYKFEEPLTCCKCGENLKDEENGPPFKKEIAISDFYLDRTVDFVCPKCFRSLRNGKKYDSKDFEKTSPESE